VLKVRDGVKVGLDVVPGELETTFEWRVAEASERWGRERENDWSMIRYVDPEVTVVNGKGDGSEVGGAPSSGGEKQARCAPPCQQQFVPRWKKDSQYQQCEIPATGVRGCATSVARTSCL